mmetsp:Transcript_21741/g.28489  ORF Transcript_21741/g.28489 Transcript_21741/m.28489 type:complete len:91 (+) Transcript_21741:2365-2637(+)
MLYFPKRVVFTGLCQKFRRTKIKRKRKQRNWLVKRIILILDSCWLKKRPILFENMAKVQCQEKLKSEMMIKSLKYSKLNKISFKYIYHFL